MAAHSRGQDDEYIDDERKFGPFNGLADACQYEDPAGYQYHEIPQEKHPAPQTGTGDLPAGQDRDCMIEKGQERVAQPAQHDALGMGKAQPAPGTGQPGAGIVGNEKLQGDQDAEYGRKQH